MLYHVTPAANAASLCEHGILASHSRGARKAVWLIDEDMIAWAILHCARRHKTDPFRLVIVEVLDDDLGVLRGPLKGLYYVPGDVRPQRICNVLQAGAWVEEESYVDEDGYLDAETVTDARG